MIAHRHLDCGDLPVDVHLSRFATGTGAIEIHVTATPTATGDIATHLEMLTRAYEQALARVGTDPSSAVLRRLFCSDLANQAEALAASPLTRDDCAISVVGQAPAGPAKVALWAYHLCDPTGPLAVARDGATFSLHRGALTHHWSTGLTGADAHDPYAQSQRLLADYARELGDRGLTLADHLVRTWFFVRDVDLNYGGLVQARRELFDRHGLSGDTHYTASTGIGGEATEVGALVFMDAWAISGMRPEQVRYLKALDHLSPTRLYGVTFERATAIAYRDRAHLVVSGTASIDARGEILHTGDISRQLERTLENVEALLAEGGASSSDMSHWLVYLRDESDAPVVQAEMRRRFPEAPMVFVHAPVCRPAWLVEVEGIALIHHDAPDLPPL